VEYEVRFVLAGRESLLFTVDDERATVWVIALRGQGPLPKPENLPRSTGALEIERTIAALRNALLEAEQSGDAGLLHFNELVRKARRMAGLPPLLENPKSEPCPLEELLRQFDDALYERLALSRDIDGVRSLAEELNDRTGRSDTTRSHERKRVANWSPTRGSRRPDNHLRGTRTSGSPPHRWGAPRCGIA
jgi:hypothetical protein